MLPAFSIKLNVKVLPKMVAVGAYDGKRPCLTCATVGGKVFIHNPLLANRPARAGRTDDVSGDCIFLNIGEPVTALACGKILSSAPDRDMLLVGTASHLLAYDVHNNVDIFYKDLPDGANTICVGKLGESQTLVFVGGSCSIYGFDQDGTDRFWTVTGDNVRSLALVDFNRDGRNELIVGSEDYEIRVFRNDELISELTETGVINCLTSVHDSRFAYALDNGTIGVYDRTARYWRIKSKNFAVALESFDLDSDGTPELITGWSNGKLDARNERTGDVIFKDTLSNPIAGIVKSDYRCDGHELLIIVSNMGEIRGWQAVPPSSKHLLLQTLNDNDQLRAMEETRKNLLMELDSYKRNLDAMLKGAGDQLVALPANTTVEATVNMKPEKHGRPSYVELSLATNNDTLIKTVVLFAEGVFDGESLVYHPSAQNVNSHIRIPLIFKRDIAVDLHVKVFVGYKNSSQFQIFELVRQLPRFATLLFDPNAQSGPEPRSFVQFQISERVQRIWLWITVNFIVPPNYQPATNQPLNMRFSMTTSRQLDLEADKQPGSPTHNHNAEGSKLEPVVIIIKAEQNGQMQIRTDDVEIAGDLVQSLCSYLNIGELQVTCDFPKFFEQVSGMMQQIADYQAQRQRLISTGADTIQQMKAVLIRAEDCRILGQLDTMKTFYSQLQFMNKDAIVQYRIKQQNHKDVQRSLRTLNQAVQVAANLRVGKFKTQLIAECRQAIKSNSPNTLVKLMKSGVGVVA